MSIVSSQTATLTAAIDYWKRFDYNSLHAKLDAQGLEVVQNQKETALNRRRLAEETKTFKKQVSDDTSKLNDFPKLLKSYQLEIDSLSKRLKSTETNFLALYTLFAGDQDGNQPFVDPLEFLQQFESVQSLKSTNQALEMENNRLRMDLDRVTGEIKQNDAVFAQNTRLQERVKLLERQVQIAENKAVLQQPDSSQLQDKIKFYQERESDLLHQLEVSENKLKSFIKSNAVAALPTSPTGSSTTTQNLLSQIDILEKDVQTYKLKSMQLERDLQAQMEASSNSSYELKIAELQRNLDSADSHHADLKRQLESSQSEMSLVSQKLKETENSLKQRITELETHLEKQKDYQLIKNELSTMKSLEFGSLLEENTQELTLEALSIQKTRRLQAELADLKLQFDETQSKLEKASIELVSASRKSEEQTVLIKKLEADLLKFDANETGTPEMRPAELASDTPTDFSTVGDQKYASLLQIITSQRDRFHKRTLELESESKSLQSTISQLQMQISTLKDDNIRLYERVRYLTSFKAENSHNRRSSSDSSTLNNIVVTNDSRKQVEKKYETMYENKLDPFSQFARREQSRRMSRMAIQDRMALHISQLFLSNKYSRMFLVGYTVLLHLLVFGMMMYAVEYDNGQTVGSLAAANDMDGIKKILQTEKNTALVQQLGWTVKSVLGNSFCPTFCSDSTGSSSSN